MMMKHVWTVVAVVSLTPAAAWAQERLDSPLPVLPRELSSVEMLQERIGHLRLSLALLARLSIPGNGTVSTAGIAYSDLFDVAAGAGLEGDLMMGMGGGLEIGGYLSGTYDSFGGTSASDDFGNVIDPDPLRVTTVMVGGKVIGHYGMGFFWEGFAGLGVVHYASTDAVITDLGFAPVKDQLFRATTHGAFEIGGRMGWSGPHVGLEVGFAYRIMAGPQRGKNMSELIDTGLFDTVVLDIGLRIRF
jgi:hypothetical protein